MINDPAAPDGIEGVLHALDQICAHLAAQLEPPPGRFARLRRWLFGRSPGTLAVLGFCSGLRKLIAVLATSRVPGMAVGREAGRLAAREFGRDRAAPAVAGVQEAPEDAGRDASTPSGHRADDVWNEADFERTDRDEGDWDEDGFEEDPDWGDLDPHAAGDRPVTAPAASQPGACDPETLGLDACNVPDDRREVSPASTPHSVLPDNLKVDVDAAKSTAHDDGSSPSREADRVSDPPSPASEKTARDLGCGTARAPNIVRAEPVSVDPFLWRNRRPMGAARPRRDRTASDATHPRRSANTPVRWRRPWLARTGLGGRWENRAHFVAFLYRTTVRLRSRAVDGMRLPRR